MNVVAAANDNDLKHNRKFKKLSESYTSVLQKLLRDKIITLPDPNPIKEPYPNRYDGSTYC